MRREKFFQVQMLLAIILLFALMVPGCSTKDAADAPPVPSNTEQLPDSGTDTAAPVQISYRVYTETFRDDEDGSVLFDLKITYPEIKNPDNDSGIAAINEYYGIQFDHYISTIISEGRERAEADKEFAESSGSEFHPHAYECFPQITYNGSNLLSVLNTQYEYTGGAHPNSFRRSETFDVKTGKKLALNDILGGSKDEALEKVYQTVLMHIQEKEGKDDFFFFENYRDDLREYYAEDDFVLTENSIMFYYQLYAIAPYAAGFPEFELPFDEAGPLALNIPELPANQLEKEIYDRAGKLIDRNKLAFFEIFGLSMLHMEIPDKRADEEVLFPVKDERFTTFFELDAYVRSTYIKSEADALLSNGRYHNIEGKLYGDLSKDGGMGYYVNWNDYCYDIGDISETSATLNLFTVEDSPAGTEDVGITVKMLKENGTWLLEKMFY